MSDLKSEPTSAETGTVGAGVAASEVSAPATAAAEVESPRLAPEQEETSPKADAPKAEMPKAEPFRFDAPEFDAPKADAPKVEVPKVDAVKPEAPRMPGKMMIMSPGERVGSDAKVEAAAGEGSSGKRRMSAMAAVVALATVAGAMGGALATAGFGHLMSGDTTVAANTSALEASIARIDADIVALKAGVEHTSKVATGQFNKTSDRLDKVEKAQAEPTAKLAKLSEAVDKLRATPAPAPVAVAAPAPAREVTGSVSQPTTVAAAAPAAAAPKPDVGRLPKVEGWVLRDVGNGGALIEGRQGIFEVYAGDPVPGLGRVDAIRKQDGKWVVVTSKGLISR